MVSAFRRSTFQNNAFQIDAVEDRSSERVSSHAATADNTVRVASHAAVASNTVRVESHAATLNRTKRVVV